ncbi:hypothetical protein D3C71_19750 [compost metagenome]
MSHTTTDANGVFVHEFASSLKTEADSDAALRAAFGAFEHLDYRAHDAARKMGFDYILKSEDAQRIAVDDKADTWLASSGNVSLELFTLSRRPAAEGWLFYSRAVALRYVSVKSGEVLVLPLDEVRAFVLPRLADFETVGVVNAPRGNFTHITFNSLVPASELLAHCPGASIVYLPGATGRLSRGISERVVPGQEAVSRLLHAGMYSRAAAGLGGPEMGYHVAANRHAAKQREYLQQCRLPAGLALPEAAVA